MMKTKTRAMVAAAAVAFALLLILIGNANARLPSPPPGGGGSPAVNLAGCAEIPYISQTVNSFVPWYCSQINTAAYNAWKGWEPVVLLAVLVSFFIGVIIFVSGIVLRNSKIRVFGTGEIYEAIATAIIAVMFTFFAAVMFGLLPSFITGPIDPYNSSLVYINQTISATEGVIRSAFFVNMIDAFYSSITLDISTFASFLPIINSVVAGVIAVLFLVPAWAITQLLMDGLLVLHTEFYLILFGMYAAIPVFLVPGIFLRALLPTRSIGGMLIAIAIGFYFVLPILFSVAFALTNTGLLNSLRSETSALNQYGAGSGAEQNAISPTSPLVETLGNVQSTLGAFWLSVLFYPALILALTYALITTMADFIGGMAASTSKLRLM